jgi:hypothetical protein
MKFRTALFAVILFSLATSHAVAQPDISQYIQNLRDIIATVPVPDPTIRDALNELLDCIENTQPSKGGYARYTTTNQLLDAFQEQFITYLTEGDSDQSSNLKVPMENGEDPTDQILENLAMAGAELFFNLPELQPQALDVSDSMNYCSVIIMAKGAGHLAFDPGSVLYVKYGERVELEAYGRELGEGVEYTWDIDYLTPSLTQGKRAFFRAYHMQTADVTVTFKSAMGTSCQDRLRVVMQDGWIDD